METNCYSRCCKSEQDAAERKRENMADDPNNRGGEVDDAKSKKKKSARCWELTDVMQTGLK